MSKLINALHRILAGKVLKLPQRDKPEEYKWMDVDVDKLKERFKDNPKILKLIEKNVDPSKNKEPYKGARDKTSTKWANPSEEDIDVPFPLPAHVGDLQGVLGKDVLVGGQDPFTWQDAKYKVSQKLLYKNYDKPLEIHTRSDLIAHDDYIAALNPNKHKVFMHIITTNDDINKDLEPGQPSALRRIRAAKKLHESLIPVAIAHDIFENKNLIPEVEQLRKLDDLRMRKEAKGVKVIPMKVKITDKSAEIVNDAVKRDAGRIAAKVMAVLKQLI